MRVYIAGEAAPGRKETVEAFGDEPVAPWELAACLDEKLELVLRLAALGRCQAILLPTDWRRDDTAALERAYAQRLRIPEVLYYRPGLGRCC